MRLKHFLSVFLTLLTLSVGQVWGGNVTWEQVAWGDITTSDVIIVTVTTSNGTYLLEHSHGTSETPKLGNTGTLGSSNTTCTFSENDDVKWKKDASNRLCKASDGTKWLYTAGSNNGMRVGTTTTGNTWTLDGDYIKSNANRYLSVYGTTDFRSYTSKQSDQVTRFYKAASCSGTKLGTPVVTAEASNKQVKLTWPAVSNASGYQLKWNGGDWAAATSPVTKTGLTNGTAYTYQVKAIGNGSTYCDGDASAAASATPNVYYTVTWNNNGAEYTTTQVVSGQRPTFPEAPNSCDDGEGASTTFYGWTTSTWSGKAANLEDSKLSGITIYTQASDMPTVTGNGVVYNAVFCKGGNNGSISISGSDLKTGLSGSYGSGSFSKTIGTTNYTFNTYGCVQSSTFQTRASDGYIQIPTLPGPINNISSSACNNAGTGNYNGTLRFKSAQAAGSSTDHDITTKAVNATSFSWDITGSATSGYITTSAGLRLSNLTITYGTEGTNYLTTCCTELGSIKGSVSLTHNSATLTWDAIDGVTAWSVSGNIKNGAAIAAGNIGAITDINNGAKKQCVISNLSSSTAYEFKIHATTISSGYCTTVDEWDLEGSTDANYTITEATNNSNYGTVTRNGNVITGTPAQYCRYATPAYTVVSGTATVEQGTGENVNKFTVTPTANCSIRINFEPIPVTGVTMSSNAETLEVGGSTTLTAAVAPNTANPGVNWTVTQADNFISFNTSTGAVSALKAGTATITATSTLDNTKTASCTVTVVPVTEYKKVTAAPSDWSGEYLLVYEPDDNTAYVWTGVDASTCYASTSIPANGKISKPNGAAKLNIASMENEGNYSIKIIGGDHNNKYLSHKSDKNEFVFGDEEAAYALGFNGTSGELEMSNNGRTIRYNPTNTAQSTQLRFRPYTSGQQPVQLYRKVVTSAVTITAPAEGTGSLTLANGQTPVASGDNIEAGTELTVTATPNAENHYIGGTIVVKKTSDNSDVPNSVWDGTTLTMPEYAITVSATFTPTYAITGASVVGGSFSWEETTGHTTPAYAAAGTQIQASANATDGYVFGGTFDIYKTADSDDKVSHTNGLFTMPAYAVTIGGTFNVAPTITLSQTSTMAFTKVATGASTSAKFTVSAANLTAGSLSVVKSGTNTDKFNLSVSSITVTAGSVSNAEVTVTPVTSATGDFTATITVDDGENGAAAQSFNVTLHVEDQYTINWYVNGSAAGNIVKSQTAFANEDLDIPTASDLTPFTDCSQFVFLGWKDGSAIDGGSSESAPTLANVGTKVAASKSYYAVFGDGSPAVDESDSWDLKTASDDWTGDNTETYFTKPYGIKKANAYIVNSSISDFENYANGADEISITVTCFQNSGSTSRLTVYLVDEDGAIIAGTGKEFTPANGSQVSDAADSEVTYNASELSGKDATGYMVKCTTYGKNILITGTRYQITKDENYTKYYTTCPQIKNVVLSAATVSHGSISFKVGGKAATNARTENGAVEVDIVETHDTGYELTGISLSELSGASYNSTTGKIELEQNTNGTLTVTAEFTQKNYSVAVQTYPASIGAELTGTTSTAKYGVEQTISTNEPTGYLFGGWYIYDAEDTEKETDLSSELFTGTYAGGDLELEASFLMPDKNLVAEAYFDKIYTVSEFAALDKEDGEKYVIEGLICNVESYSNSKYITYDISDNGVNSGTTLKIFKGLGLNGASFSQLTDLNVGERVRVYGAWDNSHTDINQDSKLYYHQTLSVTSVAIGGSAEKTAYSPSDNTFSFAGLNATAIYNTGYVKDVTAEADWTANSANPYTVAATGDVTVRATFGGQYDEETVVVTYTSKTVKSIYLEYESTYTFKGYDLPKPKVYAKYVESIADDEITSLVEAANGYDTESAYVANTPGSYTINVGYESFSAEYTVEVRKIFDNEDAPHSVADADALITEVGTGSESSEYMWVHGIVCGFDGSYYNRYYISDNGTSEGRLYVYFGQYFNGASFDANNKLKVGDVVILKAKIKIYSSTNELTSSQVTYQLRDPEFTFADIVAGDEFEAGFSADMAVVPTSNEGDAAFTLSSGNTDAVTIVAGKLHAVAEGDAVITASRAATDNTGSINYKAKNATFNVHVIAERTRYAITMDKNGGSGVDPVYENQLAGATVDLPADNTYSKANSAFDAWVVTETESGDAVAVTDGHFTMPAAAVTIQATWNDVETCTISFYVSGSEVATADAPQTAAYSLAEVYHPTIEGFTWIGWSETEYADEVTTLPTIITSYTPAVNEDSKTLYGIYSQVVGGASNLHYVLDYTDENLATNNNWGDAYSTVYPYTAADGGEWTIKAYKNSGMQINTNVNNPYIKVPNCAAKIIQVSLSCNSGAKKAVKFAESVGGDALANGSESTSQTLDLSGESVTTGYILPTGNCQITHIDVEYSGNVTYYTSSPITRYTVTYVKGDATGITGLCETQRHAAGTITLCDAPTCADKDFVKWSDGSSLYNAGASYTLSADVTFTATWTPKPKYTVTYTANGGTGTAPAVEEYMEGETVEVKENEYFSKPGFDYDGWLIVYNDGVSDRVITPEEGEFEMVAYNVTIKAKWAEESKQKWALVTNVSDLVAGDKYIIAASGYNVAMAGQNENNRAETAVVKRNEGAQLKGTSSMQVITLAGTTGAWEFNTGAGYLYAASSSKNYLRTQETNDANGKWTITISDGVATIAANGTNTNNKLKYNSSSKIFSCYGSGQQAVALYKEIPITVINTGGMDQNDVPDGGDMTINEDQTWTVTSDKEVGDLYMKDGAIIANSDGSNSAKVEANDLYFKARHGKSNQIFDLSKITVEGNMYYDFQLCDGDVDADYWYSISVPFDVNLSDGVFQVGGTTPLVNHTDFEVWEYDTQKRADTQSNGWKRSSDNKMHAGKAYLIGFNPGQPNIIRLKAAANWKEHLFTGGTSMSVVSTGGSGDHDNWNGLANPTGRYIDVNADAQVFNNNTHQFDPFTYDAQAYNFVVGTAFFVQSASAITISNTDHGNYRAPKHVDDAKCAYAVRITRDEATNFDNQIIVRASEDATGEYTQGHDMLTMNNATSKTAAMLWTENYGGKRLAIEEAAWLNGTATYVLKVCAPKAGTYSISVASVKENADLYLTYEGTIIWNLSESAYTVDLNKGKNDGYGLLLRAKVPSVVTGIENGELLNGANGVQKVIIDEHVYILRGGQMYDVNGKMVK